MNLLKERPRECNQNESAVFIYLFFITYTFLFLLLLKLLLTSSVGEAGLRMIRVNINAFR